ncbi:MAG: endolytic transglycosylase MltG [Ferruginibacter sp.]
MPSLKKIFYLFIFFVLFGTLTVAWLFFSSATDFNDERQTLLIRTGSSFEDVMEQIENEKIVKYPDVFKWAATLLKYPQRVKPGRYVIKADENLYNIIRMLRNGSQTPVNLVINKLRTKEDFAQKIANNFECDSAEVIHFLYNEDSLKKFGADTNTIITKIIPNTYSILWNTSFSKIIRKLVAEHDKFWTDERKQKANALNLTEVQVYTLASIVEEETNREEDKGKIASVYLNRLETGMRLGADPTVKYAMRNFALKRIYEKHLSYNSPYNTYQNPGLPPGPICTPSIKTIDAVLNAPSTAYLFFVAKPDFKGYSNFAVTYEEHLRYAKAYQQALDSLMSRKANAVN